MRARIIVALAVFVYLTGLRTWRISEIFGMLGDQILYWNIALGSWPELPLGGGPSSIGGTTVGPAFMWTMWGIRHVVGPWTDYLPHAGGIGLSLIQSTADVVLLLAIWRRFDSAALALAVTLFVATAPEELSLSASIWNPVLAVAFIKLAIACVLMAERSVWWVAGATALSVLALQCHSSAIFFSAPVIASLTARELLAHRRARALLYACVSAVVVLALEAPYLIDMAMHAERQTRPYAVTGSVAATLAHPATLRPVAAFRAVVAACQSILIRPWTFAWLGMLLVACAAITAVGTRRDVTLACVTVVPLLAAVAGFSFWQGTFEAYWFMTLMPSAGLTLGLALTAWAPAAPLVATMLTVLVLAAQPSRFAYALTINRMPEYGALVRGSQEIRRRLPEVRSIDIEFTVPPSTSTHFIYETILGGRVTSTAPFAATIERSGRVRFASAP